jgi:hypothetical protein
MIYRIFFKVRFYAKQAWAQTDTRTLRIVDRLNRVFMPKSKMGTGFNKHSYTARGPKVIWILWFYKH